MIVILMRQSLHLLLWDRLAFPRSLLLLLLLLRTRTTTTNSRVVGFEFLGNGDEVEVEVIADEVADFGVFVVANQSFGLLGVRGVDVDVDG